MGKTKRPKNNKRFGVKVGRLEPLADQITTDKIALPSGRIKWKIEKAEDDKFVEGSMGRKIMKQSLAQLQEINQEECLDEEEWPALGAKKKYQRKNREVVDVSLTKRGFKKKTEKRNINKDEESESDQEDGEDDTSSVTPFNLQNVVDDFEKELCLDSDDQYILEHFQTRKSDPQQRLADLFRDKITEKQTEIQTEIDAESVGGVNLSPELAKICQEIGKVLEKYRSGPLPKMFKAFPTMNCWEELTYMTNPDKWSAAAMYQATRIFISNLRPAMAQRFCHLVLLPRVRDDISFYKKLNYHLYEALRKALFKSAAFFKGCVLPLCAGGTCTLREAIIIGSVIAKNRIPLDNSAAAIMKIASMDYSGPNSIFLRVFFDKQYALPYQVLDECIEHFKRFETDDRTLPVLWHQSLLAFVQRYKNDISSEQKQALFSLLNYHQHYKITPEIRRELSSAKTREEIPMNVD